MPDINDHDEYEDQARELLSPWSRFVNNLAMNYDTAGKALAFAMHREHRTLQASIIRLIFSFLVQYSKLDGARYTDLRNEAAVNACKKLAKAMENDPDFHIPLI
jgi:hypothetical protein